jgi:hypothetical protein
MNSKTVSHLIPFKLRFMEILIKLLSNSTGENSMSESFSRGTPVRLPKVLCFILNLSGKFHKINVFQSDYFRYAAETGEMSFLETYHKSSPGSLCGFVKLVVNSAAIRPQNPSQAFKFYDFSIFILRQGAIIVPPVLSCGLQVL